MIQLYNLEGQPMEQLPDGSPIPQGRWTTPDGGLQSKNGGWGLGTGTYDGTTVAAPQQGDSLHEALTTLNNGGSPQPTGTGAGFSGLTSGGTGGATSGWSTQAYLQAHPDILNNWNGDPNYAKQYGSLENYALADAKGNGSVQEKAAAATYTPAAPYTPATATTVPGGNFNQNQNANQAGAFNTTGTTQTNQNQVTGNQTNSTSNTGTTTQQQQNGTQTGTTTDQGTSNQSQTGTQNTTTGQNTTVNGTTTTAPVDTLGFGSLLQQQAGQVGASDTARNATLTSLLQNGDPALQSQVDQAVRGSLTGPQMSGTGDSARARAAGYAAAQVGRNSVQDQLAAAQQLAGPTGLSTLSSAANPYIGSQQSQTGTTNSTGFSNLVNNLLNSTTSNNTQNTNQATSQNTTGTQNSSTTGQNTTAGFSNLTGTQNENQSGTATGQSSQAAAGLIPQAQQVATGGGGCVLCTAGIQLGLWNNLRVLRTVIDYKLRHKKFNSAARGYFAVFTPFARFLLVHPRLARVLEPLARMVVYEELRVAGRGLPLRKGAWLVHWTGHLFCHLVGKLPVAGRVIDPVIESIARKNNVWFSLP